MASEPDSEPSFESAESANELAEDLARLELEPRAQAKAKSRSAAPEPRPADPDSGVLVQSNRERHTIIRNLHSSRSASSAQPVESPRFYAVWELPHYSGATDLIGVHRGRGTSAYAGILAANQGVFTGLRFRRAPTLAAAQRLFESEAEIHQVRRDQALNLVEWQ